MKISGELLRYYLNAPAIGGGDKERGKRLAEETIALNEIQGRLLLAYSLKRNGEMAKAIAEYEHVLQLDPQNGSAYNSLGYIFLKHRDYAGAELNFGKYIKVAPDDPNAYDSMGDYYLERGMIEETIQQFQIALEVDPKFPTSRFKLAQAFEDKQMNEDAI